MRLILPVLPILLASLGAFAEPPASGPKNLTQPIRTGKGQPRVREATTAQRTTAPATGRTRPYQAPKPGEGAPKG